MRLSDAVLARRYAAAFVLAAARAPAAEKPVAELRQAARSLAGEMTLFRHPRLSSAVKKSLLAAAVGKSVSKTTLRFLELLIDKRRFGLLPQIAEEAGKVLDEKNGLLRAAVRSAVALTPAEASALRERLTRFSGKKVELEVGVDEGLLAGLRVRLGDWVLDASLRGRLRRMGESLAA